MAALASRRIAPQDASAPAQHSAAAPAHDPWAIALTVTIATFMELLDTSISNVSLPHIAGGLGTSYDESTWVLTSYLVANAVILPMSAWLSRVFARKRYYMMYVALFTATSLLCGLAPSLGMLIFFRVLQGIGGGGLAPVEQAILVDTFPAAERAGAFALYSMAIVTAPAIGPPLGEWITDSFSWRWVFFINVPIGLLSLILSSRLVHDPVEFTQERIKARRGGSLRIDYVGIMLVAVGFACLEVVLDRGERDDWLQSHFIAAFLAIAIVTIGAAIWWEWRHNDPVVELTLLRERNFALSCMYYFLFAFGLFGSTVMIPELRRTQFHRSVLVSNLTSADAMVREFVNTSSRHLVTRGASGPDAIRQAYGTIGDLLTRQATMLAFMDCFRLLALVVIIGLPLACLIRRFEIGKAGGAAH
jgi:MFS transporter, DHA2 family, multidrug resistance protein